jgi:hypothetical protein
MHKANAEGQVICGMPRLRNNPCGAQEEEFLTIPHYPCSRAVHGITSDKAISQQLGRAMLNQLIRLEALGSTRVLVRSASFTFTRSNSFEEAL